MIEEMEAYLEDIGITGSIKEKVEKIYAFYEITCPEKKIAQIFVTDYVEDEERRYQNLWFFSENFSMEAKDFLNKDDFDMDRIDEITYWHLEKKNYDFSKPTGASRLHLEISFSYTRYGDFKASGNNCEHLNNLFMNFLLPKFREAFWNDEKHKKGT